MQRKSGKQREGLLRCGGLLLTGLLLAASAACSRRGSAGPNVLLLTLDTTRADHLGAYGYARGATPVLDRLARRGALFTETVTTAPLTLPAHASIMTGTYPARHGARDNGIYVLADAPNRTLAETLGERGYQTAAVVSAFVLERRFGLAQGFDAYEDDPGEMSAGEARLDPERPAASATDAALRLARGTDPRRPLFLWVHYFDAHAPYAPPEPDRTRFQPTREDPQRGYDGEIASMDREIGRLLTGLRRLGRLRHCLVVVVGDHGDGLATLHLEKTHGVFLYRETLHVPLILHDTEGRIPPRVVAGLSRVVDVAPTILGYLGFPGPADGEGDAAGRGAGLSLLARAGGGTAPGAPAHLRALAETLMPYDSFGWSPLFSLRSGRWKLIRAPRPELYDLERDPGEQVNRYGEEPEVARDMEALLDRELDGASRGGRPPPPNPPPPSGRATARSSSIWDTFSPRAPPRGFPPRAASRTRTPRTSSGCSSISSSCGWP